MYKSYNTENYCVCSYCYLIIDVLFLEHLKVSQSFIFFFLGKKALFIRIFFNFLLNLILPIWLLLLFPGEFCCIPWYSQISLLSWGFSFHSGDVYSTFFWTVCVKWFIAIYYYSVVQCSLQCYLLRCLDFLPLLPPLSSGYIMMLSQHF